MSLTINSNIQSLNTQRHLANAQGSVATAMQRLSSGVRINSAKDDAAGLAISDRMTSQIRGMNQAARNLNDGISMLQTAEGALQEVTNLIQRGRELAVQAGNDATLSASDKDSLQGEIVQILAEVDRIANTTTFNGTSLLNQGESTTVGSGSRQEIMDGLKSSWLANSEQRLLDQYQLSASDVDFSVEFVEDSGNSFAAWVLPGSPDANGIAQSVTLTIDLSDYDPANAETYDRLIAHEMTHAIMAANMDFSTNGLSTWFKEGAAELIAGGDERLQGAIASAAGATTTDKVSNVLASIAGGATFPMNSSEKYAAAYAGSRFMHEQIKAAGGTGIDEVMVYLRDNAGASLDAALADVQSNHGTLGFNSEASFLTLLQGGTGVAYVEGLDLSNADVGAIGGADADGGAVLTAQTVISDTISYSENPLTGFTESWPTLDGLFAQGATASFQFQAGANAGQTIAVALGTANTTTLNIADVDISTNAGLAISRFDAALGYIDTMRGDFGAVMNRLESSVAGLANAAEQISAARSRILDADIAQETSTLTKGSILQQAGVSILAQANQQPQLALSLLQ